MEIAQSLVLTSLLLFGYVAVRFAWEMRSSTRRRAVAGTGLIALLPPTSGYLYQWSDGIPPEDLPAYAVGSIIWVTLAMALGAYAMSRSREVRT